MKQRIKTKPRQASTQQPDYLKDLRSQRSIETSPRGILSARGTEKIKETIPATTRAKPNYLAELREQRQENGLRSSDQTGSPEWIKKVMNNDALAKKEKMEMVRRNAEIMEDKAKQLEVGVKDQSIDHQLHVNQLYMKSIRAKAALLDHI